MAVKSLSLRLISVLLPVCSGLSGGSLEAVWTLDLHKVPGVAVGGELPIRALRFSPDGQHIAIVAGFIKGDDGHSSNLFVGGVKEPAATKRITIPTSVDELEGGLSSNNFQWSPSGSRLFVGGTVVSLPGYETCAVPVFGGFISDDRIITYVQGDGHRFREFDTDCQPISTWETRESWFIEDRSPEKNLLLVSREMPLLQRSDPPNNEVLVVRASDRAVIGRWPSAQGPMGRFADSGKAICGGGDADEVDRVPVHCWDSITGKVIATAPTVNGGSPFAVATNATRMIASDYHRYRIPFTSEYGERLKARVVWDFGTGKELASWRPEKQDYVYYTTKTPTKVADMAKFAISPDGNYILDGANGIVRLYKIVP
jgi:dipeptidyl aminopeptidase/acylaminoacyl peptidase